MFTNNYISFRKGQFSNDSSNTVKRVNGATHNYADTYYTAHDIGAYLGTPRTVSPLEGGASGVYFGSGTTPPTKEDWLLETPIASGLEATGYKTKADMTYDGNKAIAEGRYMVKNISEEDITIGEVGYFGQTYSATTIGLLTLYERSLVEPPVVIPPGETRLITYRITIEGP